MITSTQTEEGKRKFFKTMLVEGPQGMVESSHLLGEYGRDMLEMEKDQHTEMITASQNRIAELDEMIAQF